MAEGDFEALATTVGGMKQVKAVRRSGHMLTVELDLQNLSPDRRARAIARVRSKIEHTIEHKSGEVRRQRIQAASAVYAGGRDRDY